MHLLALSESICYRIRMDAFHTYLKALTKDQRVELAEKVDTTVAYLWQIAYGQRRCREGLAIEIEKATSRAVRLEMLRPDIDWAYVRSSAQSIADSDSNRPASDSTDDVQPPTGGRVGADD